MSVLPQPRKRRHAWEVLARVAQACAAQSEGPVVSELRATNKHLRVLFQRTAFVHDARAVICTNDARGARGVSVQSATGV